MASALRWLDGLGMEAVRDHEREITAYALERLAEVPGLRVFGPPRRPRAPRPGLLRAGGRPRPRRLRDPRPPRRRGPRRPPLRPGADGPPRGAPPPPAPASASTRRPRRSTAWSRACTTRVRSSASDGRALPRPDPRALQAPTQLRSPGGARPRVRGHQPVLRRRAARDDPARRGGQGGRDRLRRQGLRDLDRGDLAAHRRAGRQDRARSCCDCRRSSSSTCSGSRSRRRG